VTDITEVLRLIRRYLRQRSRLVVLAAVCGAVIGCFVTFAVPPTYSANATIYVAPPVSSSATDAVSGDQYAQNRTQLYWQLTQSDELARRVAGEMKSAESPAALAARISVSLIHDAPLLTIQATGPTADAARSLARAYLNQLPDYARSVEQNSGLRDGPVLVTVAQPIEVTKSTAGMTPWLKVLLTTAMFGGAALAFTLLERRRRPTVRSIGQIRKAVPKPWIVEVDGGPGEMARIQAMLFSAPNSTRKVILAGARSDDGLDGMIAHFAAALQGPILLPARAQLVPGPRRELNDVEISAAPALLDQHERITALVARSSTGIMISAVSSVIMCLKGQTVLEDLVDLIELLSVNGVDVNGILMVRRGWRKRIRRRVSPSRRASNGSEPSPRIDVVECGKPSRNGDRTLC
jgi:capsular polysaccharide biosynthesis protein